MPAAPKPCGEVLEHPMREDEPGDVELTGAEPGHLPVEHRDGTEVRGT